MDREVERQCAAARADAETHGRGDRAGRHVEARADERLGFRFEDGSEGNPDQLRGVAAEQEARVTGGLFDDARGPVEHEQDAMGLNRAGDVDGFPIAGRQVCLAEADCRRAHAGTRHSQRSSVSNVATAAAWAAVRRFGSSHHASTAAPKRLHIVPTASP